MDLNAGCVIVFTRADGKQTRHNVVIEIMDELGYLAINEGQDRIATVLPSPGCKLLLGQAIPHEGGTLQIVRD